jgi:isoquinoline 1-oxidoreductase beta subunit
MVRRIDRPDVSRRTLLIGGGLGVGLLIAWGIWPRSYPTNLRAAPGESLFNAFLKIGDDGRVVVAVPQAEVGQGVYTSLPQILADELGADWRTVSVEPAPLNPIYANQLLIEELAEERIPSMLSDATRWAVREFATRSALVLTGGSTSVRAFEPRLREAGAAGRVLLCKAAARRWGVDWEALEAHDGFIWNDKERLSFGELAAKAMRHSLPETLPLRVGSEHRLTGQALPRLDLPSKVDGSAQFAGDIRLPDMIYASARQGPVGSRLVRVDREAADRVPGVISVLETPNWAAALADNWWAANRAVEAMRPRFDGGLLINSEEVDRTLVIALRDGDAGHVVKLGNPAQAVSGGQTHRAEYAAGIAPNAPVETLTATARLTGDRLEIWAPTQAPGLARAAAALAAGISEGRVTLYPTLVGGGYGRKLETGAIEQAVIMAMTMKRPVQLVWSRIEETLHDSFRPPARARLEARLANNGAILGWNARIAAPPTISLVTKRLRHTGGRADEFDAAAVDGAVPPYQIGDVSIEYVRADVEIPTGVWRSAAHSYTAFFTESFVDELARQAKVEPLSFRMQMLGQNVRLARALTMAASLGGWDGGGPGSAMGIAAHSAFGSHAALMVEIEIDKDQRIRVRKAACAVDCGRIINPEIVRQQIEGAIIFGIAGATGYPIRFERGLPKAIGFRDLGIPRLAQSPEVIVELIESDEASGGVTELGVPPVAPAIANAVFALTGQRLRSLPLAVGGD